MDSGFPIQKWLQNETLFSLCSRGHKLVCNQTEAATCRQWFGDSRQGMQHDFPCNLSTFADRTNNNLGSAVQIVQEHTILPFFAPFQSHQRIQHAVNTLLGPNVGMLKYQLGLLTGRFGAAHPLKACPNCIVEEIESSGFTYWHLNHQYPGTLICTQHRTLLLESKYKRIWAGRFKWCLPELTDLINLEWNVEPPSLPISQISNACVDLAELGFHLWLNPALVRKVYTTELLGEGIPVGNGTHLNSDKIDSFLSFADFLRPYYPFNALPTSQKEARTYLLHLMRSSRAFGHPLRHLVVITWLFNSIKAFLSTYNFAASNSNSFSDQKIQEHTCNIPPIIEPTGSSGALRPKKLKPPQREKALRLLEIGTDKAEVARLLNVKVSTINKLLRSEPNIRIAWNKSKTEREIGLRRACWVACSSAHPGQSTQSIRKYCMATYAWLYRNDLDWLKEQVKNLPSGRRGNHSKIDWNARDQELYEQLTIVAESLLLRHGGVKTKRHLVYELLPKLPSALRRKDKYVMTRKLFLKISCK